MFRQDSLRLGLRSMLSMSQVVKQHSRSLHLKVSAEVKEAFRIGTPVVALESTIISHGMPFPQNLSMATEVETLIRENGACPATIAILGGEICVGLSHEQLHTLAEFGSQATKCSTRDVAAVVARKGTGATTVSSTMYELIEVADSYVVRRIAHAAGIQVFVTGGIGGVHRFCEETMDISTDLMELSRTPVAVICAGVKSILDIPRTLEYLETHAVPVMGFKTKEFPAFFTQTSGSPAQLAVNSAAECADIIKTSAQLKLPNGFIVAVPNPNPVDADVINTAITNGLNECKQKHITGNAVTPYLLKRINGLKAVFKIVLSKLVELTQGVSLTSNIALVKKNAVVGAQIACALAGDSNQLVNEAASPDVVVVGGAVLDVISKPTGRYIRGTSNVGETQQTWGGVGRNIAECLHRLDVQTMLVSNVGDDACGQGLTRQLQSIGMDITGISTVNSHATATYCAMLKPTGDLDIAIADMAIFDAFHLSDGTRDKMKQAALMVLDGNVSVDDLPHIIAEKHPRQLVWFEPTSVEKSLRPVHANCMNRLNVISPNRDELDAMCHALEESGHKTFIVDHLANTKSTVNNMEELANNVVTASMAMQDGDPQKQVHVLVTLGEDGVLVGTTDPDIEIHQHNPHVEFFGSYENISFYHIPGSPLDVTNCTGAGDSFVGGAVYGLLKDMDIIQSSKLGMVAARKSLGSEYPIHPHLSRNDFE